MVTDLKLIGALRLDFDASPAAAISRSAITSDAGLLPYRELETLLGRSRHGGHSLLILSTGKNGRHDWRACCPIGIRRLAGYEM